MRRAARASQKKTKKKGVFLTYTQYRRLLEDIHDLAVAAERRDEKSISLNELEKQLRKEGLVPRRS